MTNTFLISALASIPYYGLWVVAIVLAVSRWSKHPTVSALIVVGGCLQLVASLARFVVPMASEGLGLSDHNAMGFAFALLGLVSTGGLACVVAAVFAERDAPAVR